MKRICLAIAAVVAMLLLIACRSGAVGEDASANPKPLTEKQPEVKLKTDESVSGAWKEGNGIKAHGAIVLENKGESPVEIHSVRLDFKDGNQKLLASEDILAVVPKIVQPGERVHIGATTDLRVKDPENLESISPSIEADPAWKESVNVEAKQVKWKVNGDNGAIVEGSVVNGSEEDVTDLFVTTAFRDENGKLVGVVNDYLDVALAPGEEEEFKTKSGSLPAEWLKEVSEVDVKAYPLFREEP
ncbi:FxLYD domain-containing protein [Desmospora profundinema]|uniref:Lipoprotein n=1 Tax=Desmospora profundinema TaxID=1571184 RepID=A0ABU1IMF5_9BACL|nr:FxLYD domain-containing protein [Desmospora profundinema]MDR6225958.1 hypothetical protein [Desmospora profundinema]